MLTKYKPICPVVSSKDFQLIQDASILDKQDLEETELNETKRKIKSKRKAAKRKSVTINLAKSRDESDKEEKNSSAEKYSGEEEEEEVVEPIKKKAAWIDEDDGITLEDAMNSRTFKKNRTVRTIEKNEDYGDYLKRKFISRNPRPTWADPKPEADTDDKEEDDLTKQAGGFVQKSRNRSLAANYLSVSRLNDVNRETRGQEGSLVTAVEFHPHLQVALVAGQTGVLSLFQITGGADNPKLAQVRADNFPIRVAHFCADTQVLAGSDKSPDMFIYNMETGEASKTRVRYQENIKNFRMSPDSKSFAVCGENGSVRLYTSRTKEFIQQFKMNCYVNDVLFSPSGHTLYSHGGTGEIYEWDLRSPLPVQTFADDGCLKGSRLAITADGKLLAAGSSSGVVNIYDLPVSSSRPAPHKTLLQLTTGITDLVFNPSGDILAFSSLDKTSGLRLYNVRSRQVFLNFPDPRMRTLLCRPTTLAFSPGGGYFSCTNNDKSAFLFRLHHYENY